MALIADSAPLIASMDRGDRMHRPVREIIESSNEPIFVSPFVLAEVDYFLGERTSLEKQLDFLRDVADGLFILERFDAPDVDRCIEVLERYPDQRIGLADASNVVLADRHRTTQILTFDERHFRVLRPTAGAPFTILPADS